MTSVTKTAYYFFSTFYREDGSVLEGAGSQRGRSVIARTLLDEPVFCQLDQIEPELWGVLRDMQPNFFQPFDRVGIDPFTQRFPVTLILEGTVRGTGGLRIVDDDCSTTVPGLFAAGDAATRELICGGFTGGGSHNSAWAISSGTWAGQGAARHALAVGVAGGTRHIRGAGTAALRPTGNAGAPEEFRDVVATVQGEVQPYDKNYFRTGAGLAASLAVLDSTWIEVRRSLLGQGKDAFRRARPRRWWRTARWMYRGAGADGDPRHAQARRLPGARPGAAAPPDRRRPGRGVDRHRVARRGRLRDGPLGAEAGNDRGRQRRAVHRLRPVRQGLPDERVRPGPATTR